MAEDDKDATQAGGAPPPSLPSRKDRETPESPKRDEQAERRGEDTQPGGAPPPVPPKPPASGAAGPTAPTPPAAETPPAPPSQPDTPPPADEPEEDEEEATVLAPRQVATPASLQRVKPKGRSEVVELTLSRATLGRSRGAEIRLYSDTASRQHAVLSRQDDGWVLEPLEDKSVMADGRRVRGALRLTHKMRLQLGGDELIFFDPTAAESEPTVLTGPPPRERRSVGLIISLALIVVLLAIAILWSTGW